MMIIRVADTALQTVTHLLDRAVLVDGEVVVAQLGSPAAVDQHVRGFDIPVDDAVLVQVLQPVRHV